MRKERKKERKNGFWMKKTFAHRKETRGTEMIVSREREKKHGLIFFPASSLFVSPFPHSPFFLSHYETRPPSSYSFLFLFGDTL